MGTEGEKREEEGEEGEGKGRGREERGRRKKGTIYTHPCLLSSCWFDKDEVDVGQTQGSSDKFTRVMELPQKHGLNLVGRSIFAHHSIIHALSYGLSYI